MAERVHLTPRKCHMDHKFYKLYRFVVDMSQNNFISSNSRFFRLILASNHISRWSDCALHTTSTFFMFNEWEIWLYLISPLSMSCSLAREKKYAWFHREHKNLKHLWSIFLFTICIWKWIKPSITSLEKAQNCGFDPSLRRLPTKSLLAYFES